MEVLTKGGYLPDDMGHVMVWAYQRYGCNMIRSGIGIVAFTLLLLSAGMLKAQDVGSREEQLRQLPVYEFWRAAFKEKDIDQEQSDRVVTILIKSALQSLGYQIDLSRRDPPWRDSGFMTSLKLFEKDAGLVADGSLTMDEFGVLQKAASVAGNTEASFGSFGMIEDFGDSMLATGTWVFDFDQLPLASPMTVQIWCERQTWSCRATGARVVLNDNFSPTLLLDEEDFSIVSWHGDTVIAQSERFPRWCRSATLTIDTRRNDVSVTLTARGACIRLLGRP
jgi:hypothetical protein